jgi:hypothetical protein
VRSWLSGRRFNHYGVAALSAMTASGVYVLAAAPAGYLGSALRTIRPANLTTIRTALYGYGKSVQ